MQHSHTHIHTQKVNNNKSDTNDIYNG